MYRPNSPYWVDGRFRTLCARQLPPAVIAVRGVLYSTPPGVKLCRMGVRGRGNSIPSPDDELFVLCCTRIHAFRRDELSEFQVTLQASAETTISLRIDNPEQAKKWLAAD